MSQHSSLNRFDEDENFCDECEQEDESESEAEDEDDTQMIQKNVFMMQLQKMDLFIAQDMETGHFDVTFEVDKKLIYAHKFNLCSASEVFQRQFSKRWSKKAEQNETIKIEHYGYEEFWQFLCFIYSGTCALSNETVFSIAGMAEFYGIPTLKEYCDVFLSKLENDIDMINIFEKADFAQSYSLSKYLKSLKRFICQNLDALIKADDFFFYEKSFIEILVTVDRNYDEEQFFVKVYHWALQQANLKKEAAESEEFNLDLAIKNELRGIICHIKFSRMNLQFLLDFIADKQMTFTPSQLYKMLYLSRHENQEELLFETLVKMAEKVAKADRTPSFSQKVLDVVITEASKFLSKIKFSAMSFEFIKNYVVKKSFLFTASELYKIVSKCKRDTEQEAELFETLYGLAEDQEVKKEIQDLDVNYDFSQSIHNALSEILKNIHFHHMPFEFLMDFVVEKGFFLPPFDLSDFASKSIIALGNKEDAFKNVYFLAEKQAMKKHKEAIESDPNFKLIDAVKLEMIHVFDRLRFSELNVDFLKDFIVEKGFIIYPRDLYAFFKECRIRYGNENDAFKAVYEVAEKQAARKQQTSSEDIIILSDFVKNELVKLRRDIDYRSMTKQFLMDYVVRKGFITRSTALNFAGICVEIKSQQKVIRGFFKDIYGIYDLLQPNGHKFPVRNDKLQRYTTLKKLPISKWPPVVQKMKGVHWYLCRENDGTLAVKHQTMIHSSDYLIAEMKQDREETSDFALITSSFITAKHCDV